MTRDFQREPLLAGVEDNPVFRLLIRHGNWRKSNLQVNLPSGIEQLFNFQDWVWNDLEVLPLTARDYAQALWATHFEPSGRKQIFYPIMLAVSAALVCALNYWAFMKNSIEAGSPGSLFWTALMGYNYYASGNPASSLPPLIMRANRAKSWMNRALGLYLCIFYALIIMGCEIAFVFVPAKSVGAILLKYSAGVTGAFFIGWAGAWAYMKYVKPGRMKMFEDLASEIEFLLEQRRRNREGELEKSE